MSAQNLLVFFLRIKVVYLAIHNAKIEIGFPVLA